MKIALIVAVSENNVIGKDNRLIWHLPSDMMYFKEKTKGHCVITGRKNYESIPEKFRPLPGRINIVITANTGYDAPGAIIVHSLEEALAIARRNNETEAFIIGGGQIYSQALPLCDTIYLTRVHNTFEGDTFFPEINSSEWKMTCSDKRKKDEKNPFDYTFYTYERLSNS